MDEERLRGLFESPLDEGRRTGKRTRRDQAPRGQRPPRQVRAERRRSWVPLLAALGIGGVIALAGFALAGGDDPVAAPSLPPAGTEAAPSTAAGPAGAFGVLPEGYHALNERVGARPERVLVRDDTAFVTLSLAVRSSLDPDETAGFSGGQWAARLRDGRTITAIGEFADPFARGVFTVAIPLQGSAAADIDSLDLTAEAFRSGTTHTDLIAIEGGLPWSGVPDPGGVPLEGELTFVVDRIDLDGEGGLLAWHFEEAEDVLGAVTATISMTAEAGFPAGFMSPRQSGSFLGFFGSATAPPELARSGVVDMVPIRLGRPSTVENVDVTWTIDWFSLVPTEATVPMEGVPVARIG